MQIELTELLSFGKQFGLALAGAAALWGLVFTIKGRHKSSGEKCVIFEWISVRLLVLFFIGVIVATVSWLFLVTPLLAHEGITIIPTSLEVLDAFDITSPVFLIWFIVLVAGIIFKIASPKNFHRLLGFFYALHFLFALFLISVPSWTGAFSGEQFFFFGHAAHSIFTLGTVLVLDFLFLISRHSAILRQHIFPLFPTISKVIWIGLGVDFLSVALIFPEVLALTPKFFFMQTVIGIIIINGVFLSGPITRKILRSIESGGEALTKKWTLIASTAGVISITSWFTITLVGSFENLTLNYFQFIFFYLGLLLIGFLGHMIWQYFERHKPLFIKT